MEQSRRWRPVWCRAERRPQIAAGRWIGWDRQFPFFFAEGGFEFGADVFVFFQENAGVFAALAHTFAGVADPSAGLFENTFVHAEVDEVAFAGDTFAVENVEFGFAEWCGDLATPRSSA